MLIVAMIAALVAAALHVLFFCFESLWWTTPAVRRRFRMSEAQAEASKGLALNQGWYNLFLAAGNVIGVVIAHFGHLHAGVLLIAWNSAVMLGAAVVLVVSSPAMLRGALIQGVPPLIALASLASSGAWQH